MNKTRLARTSKNEPINGFSPDPDKSQVININNTTYTLNVSDFCSIMFRADQDIKVYYNNNSNKTMTYSAFSLNSIIINNKISTVNFVATEDTIIELEGM